MLSVAVYCNVMQCNGMQRMHLFRVFLHQIKHIDVYMYIYILTCVCIYTLHNISNLNKVEAPVTLDALPEKDWFFLSRAQ
jgi:hypothetical protein